MRTPPSNSPPTSGDERSPPATPPSQRSLPPEIASGVLAQVNDMLAENEGEGCDQNQKRKREERERMLAAQAEKEKLLDKDWREGSNISCLL